MEFLGTKTLIFCNILVLLLIASSCLAQDPVDYGFSYNEDSPNGPSNWGTIRPEWRTCSDGEMQSPINIWNAEAEISPELGKLNKQYKPSEATLVNRGFDVKLEWVNGGGHVLIDGTLFQLIQCHWHAPSEHHINGQSYDLEIHLVHVAKDDRIAVIGILYEIGLPNPFISMLEPIIENLVDTYNEEENVGIIDPEWIKTGYVGEYYRYMGSLTTPPCSENITWTVIKKVETVSRRQVELLRRAILDETKTNARPIQPLNNRQIKLYKPRIRNHLDNMVQYVLGSLGKTL